MDDELFTLPINYDPSQDMGRTIVEHFLDYDTPPTKIRAEPLGDGRWAAVASWDEPE